MTTDLSPSLAITAITALRCSFCLAIGTLSIFGQSQPATGLVLVVEEHAGTIAPTEPLPPLGVPGQAPAAATVSSSPEDERLKEILQLQFDRRPQELLQTLARQMDPVAQQTNEVQRFREDVIAGRWVAVGEFIKELPEPQRAQVYQHVLTSLQAGSRGPGQGPIPPGMPGPGMEMHPGMPPNMVPGPVLLPNDVLALADVAPGELTEPILQSLGQLLSRALSKGNYIEPLVARLEQGTARLGGSDPGPRAAAVKLLVSAGRVVDAGKLLPPLEEEDQDLEARDLHARYHLELGRQGTNTYALQKSWELTQEILMASATPALTNSAGPIRDRALQRALELLPQMSQQGFEWLRASFRDQPARGMAILAAAASPAADFRNPQARHLKIAQQHQAVTAMLQVVGGPMTQWSTPLTIMAMNWAQEAEMSRTRWMDRPRFNPNYGYFDPEEQMRMQRMNDPNQPQPIPPAELLQLAPDSRWLGLIDPSFSPRVEFLTGALQIKVDEPQKALESVAELAGAHPVPATELAHELLNAWGRARNPSQNPDMMRMRYGPYGAVFYGMGGPYGPGGQGIALTRAMQNRNLVELAELVNALRQLPLKDLDENILVNAFTSAHSQAEVFAAEHIEQVFGKVEAMKMETLAALLHTMRTRLATSWRNMRVQQDAKTKRTDKDIEAEVTRGYELLTGLLERGLSQWPNHWRLHMIQAIAWFDFAEFQYGKKVDLAVYVEKREQSFNQFQKAAALYGDALSRLEPNKYSPEIFVNWFNANLGASDLAYVTRQQDPSTNNLDLLRDTLLFLPNAKGPAHMELFAKALNESLNTIKPELKPRYARAALRVTGEVPAANEIRKLARYYDDLMGEIALEVRIDGDPLVGHTAPFGVFISLWHSVDVERESGGFARYLQNQSQPYYAMMYGGQRNAREDFEKQLREKLGDTFEIKATTFADEKVQSRGIGRRGWRETPLAYLLLKAKDGAVDRLPPLHFDLDFQDQRGQVVLPVESPVVLLDARPERGLARPLTGVAITQTLDDREAAAGKLTLDVRATGRGLIPEMKDLVEGGLAGFRIVETNDSGANLVKLDTEGDELAAVTERSWVYNLEPEDRGGTPLKFLFPQPRSAAFETLYKRYADADIVEVEPELAIAGVRLRTDWTWAWIGVGTVLLGGTCFIVFRRRLKTTAADLPPLPYSMPNHVTPFSALKLLRQIETDQHLALAPEKRTELAKTIRNLEQNYFSPKAKPAQNGNLKVELENWLPK